MLILYYTIDFTVGYMLHITCYYKKLHFGVGALQAQEMFFPKCILKHAS